MVPEARSVAQAVRSYFGSGHIDPAVYRDHVAGTPGPDLADRVHTAAAIGGRATAVLTKNGLEAAPERTRAIWSAGRPESGGQRVLHTMDGSTHAVRGQPE